MSEYIEDTERELRVDIVAIEVLRRATEDFNTVEGGWAHFPDLSEENWERVASRLYDMVHRLAIDNDLPGPWEAEHEIPGWWNNLQFTAQQFLAAPNENGGSAE